MKTTIWIILLLGMVPSLSALANSTKVHCHTVVSFNDLEGYNTKYEHWDWKGSPDNLSTKPSFQIWDEYPYKLEFAFTGDSASAKSVAVRIMTNYPDSPASEAYYGWLRISSDANQLIEVQERTNKIEILCSIPSERPLWMEFLLPDDSEDAPSSGPSSPSSGSPSPLDQQRDLIPVL